MASAAPDPGSGFGGVPQQPAAPRPATIPGFEAFDPSAGLNQSPAHVARTSQMLGAGGSDPSSGGAASGGSTPQPPAPKPGTIPGFENFDPTAGLNQPAEHVARVNQVLAAGNADPGSTSTGATVPAGLGTSAPALPGGQSNAPSRAYSVGQDGTLSLDPKNLVSGLLDANKDGLIDSDKLKGMLPSALQAEQAAQDQASLQQRVSADDWAKGKAYAHGAAGGLSFIAGATPGAIMGGNIGTAAGGVVGAALTPFVGPEVLPPLLTGGRILGSVIGGLAGGKASEGVAQQVGNELAQHSATIKSFSDAAQVYPNYDRAGQLSAFLLPAGGAIRSLSKVSDLAGGGLPGAQAVANRVGLGALGGAAFEGVARPAFDATVNAGANALGIQTNPVQMPTVSSVAENAALGVLLAGHGINFDGINESQLGSILNRGAARERLNVAFNENIPPDKLAAMAQANPGIDSATLDAFKTPLTPAERELYFKARNAIEAMTPEQRAAGFVGTAEQATQGGQPIGAARVTIGPKAAVPGSNPQATSTLPSLLQSSPGQTPAPQDVPSSSAIAPAVPPAASGPVPQPSASAPPTSSSPTGTSIPSTAPDGSGQAQGDEPVVTRAGGMSTVTRGGTSLTVPTSAEEQTVALMRQAASVPAPAPASDDQRQPAVPAAPQVISSASFADVIGDAANNTAAPSAGLAQRTQSLNAQMQSALTSGQRVDMVRVGSDGTETRQQVSRAADGRMVDENGNTVRAGAALTPDTRFEIAPPGSQPPAAGTPPTSSAPTSAPSTPGQPSAPTSPAPDPALTALQQTRDGTQALLDAGKVAPEAVEHTRGLVSLLDQQISTLTAPQAPADSAPPAAPATPDAPAPDAPAPVSDGVPPATDLSSSGSPAAADTLPSPRANGSLPVGASSSASPDNLPLAADRTPAAGQPPAPESAPPTAYHQRLADTINSSALSDQADGRPSTTYQVLQRLKAGGAPITPEVARDVSDRVSAIRANADLDLAGKQEALRQIVRNGLPTEQHQDTPSDTSSLSSAPAPQSASDLQRTSSGTSTAPATEAAPDADEAAFPAAPRQAEDRVMQTPAGPKLIPADTDDVAAARTWLADQRENGNNPTASQVAQQTGLDLNTASRLRSDQQAAETRAAIPETPEVPHVKMGDKILADPARPPWTVSKLYEDGRVGITSPSGVAKAQMKGVNALAKKVQPTPQAPAAPPAPPSANGSPAAPAGDGSAAPATTYSRVVGQRIDNKTTAFSPESGTLGIPRNQMPQVASEHRGAMAQFLQARGMQFSAQDELPGSLKPSQAEFNPGKVAKAGAIREAGDATPRRILTSSDGHVIDGHHQWLDRLQNQPDQPMPTLKINAPARDILRRVHEFPSANMEKAPDIVSADGGEVSQSSAQVPVQPPAARQPVTGNGKVAADAIARLTARKAAGEVLTPTQESSLAAARELLARDLNAQVLGKDPQPVTEAGKAALQRIQFLQQARDAGAKLSPSDHASWASANRTLQSDFTQQRLAIDAKQAQATAPTASPAPPAPALSQNEPGLSRNEPAPAANPVANSSSAPASAPSAPGTAAPVPAATFKPRQEVIYKGRPAVVESIDGDRAVVRVRAGQDPTTGANLVAKKVTNVPVSSLQAKPEPEPAAPITIDKAAATAQRQINANRGLLESLGVGKITFGPTDAASGVEIGDDGTLRVQASKLATSMTTVRDNQARNGIAGTPEDWFSQVLLHEGIHAADAAVARAKGQTLQQRYEALPSTAMPQGWQEAGRDVYGAKSWDALPEWKQKAEFVRQVVEGKWTGKITEQIYKFIREAIDYLKSVAGFKDADPRFKAHVEEVESRIEAARAPGSDGSTAAPTFRAGGRASYGRRAATIQAIDGDTATIQLKGSKTPIRVPVADLKPPVARRFVLPSTATGQPDVIDHIAENGGMRGSVAGKRIAAGKGIDVAGDYDDRPNLKGVYQNAVFGGDMTPDQMASLLHEDHGIGDGSVGEMYSHIDRAMQSRESARAEQERQATVEKQAGRFEKDALSQATAKGRTEVYARELSPGDKVQVGDQTLTVATVDPDGITLEDHSRYGEQQVADGQKLYVEKVERAPGNDSLAAARPDRQTLDLFPEDEPFDLRGEALPDAERVAAARGLARQQPAAAAEQPASPASTVPRISAGERGTGDLFQGDDAPFNLRGERGIDGARAQQDADQAARDAAEAKANQDRDQLDFTTVPAPEPAPEAPAAASSLAAPATPPAPPAPPAPRPAVEKVPAGISDFGEKIQGARKDVWGKFGRAMQDGLPANASDITLSKHFPEPDYEKLLADGVPERDLATMKALRDMIPPKPQRSYKLAAWGNLVKGMHEAMRQLVSPGGSVTSAKIDAILAGSRQLANQVNLYRDLGYPAFTRAKDWTLREGTFDTFMGKNYSPAKTIAYAEHKGRMQMDMSSEAPTAAERSADIARQVKQKIDATAALPPEAKETKFGIYLDRYTSEAFIGKKGPNGVVRVKSGFKNTKEALDYRDSNKEELAAKWEEMKQPPNLRRAANNPRVGVERRDGDVAPEQFQDAFGFRGVQFGNYVEGPRRQADLNEAFDALTDLSETLGIPTKALSLDGSLGLAFGARGGGTAKAHYEPGQVVINLTKTQGPGSLAHEWFHALDNYFARLDRTGSTAPTPVDGYGTRDTARPQNMRPEVWQAFKGIRDVVNRGDFSRRSGALDATRSKPYFGTTIEKAARAFETYVEERLAKTGISNDYLVNIDKAGSDAYPTTPELDGGIRGAYDNLFNTLDTKQTDKGTALYAAAPEAEPPGGERKNDPTRLPDIKSLVDETTGANAPQGRRYVGYGTVSPEQAAQLKADTGLDLAGYRRNLDNMAVRHVLKNHGDPAAEIARGNAPMTREDFERLPQLLNHPDASLYAGKNARGHDVILSAKRVNGHFVIVEEARDGKQVLNLTTLYKKSAPPLARGPDGQPDPALLQSTARATLLQASHNFNLPGGPNDPSTLAAAAPEAEDDADPLTNSLFGKEGQPAPAKQGGFLQRARAELARRQAQMTTEDHIASHFDAVDTHAGEMGDQAAKGVRLDIKDLRDRQAATAILEAGGQRATLQADLAKVQASKDPKLAREFAPIYQHALDNLPRLNAAADGYRQRDLAEDAAADKAGLTPQWQARTKHILDDPLSPESTVVADHGFGATKGFRTQADAIAAGVKPKSMDLADMARQRVYNNQKVIGQKAFQDELTSMKAADGKPIIGGMVETSERLRPDGTPTVEQKVPKGYESVQAGNNLLTVHKDFAPLVRALYDPSAIQATVLGRAVLKALAMAKTYTLVGDTFHIGRVLFKQLTHGGGVGYGKGTSLLEYSDADLDRAVQAGELDKTEADFARKNRPAAQELIEAGLNVGKMGDNLAEQAHAHIPGMQRFNDWVFKKLSRGAMLQTALAGLARNVKRFPELSRAEVVRRTSKEYNEVFGNLGHQGLFKSATMQDAARLAFLAPNWTVSQLLSELRGLGQMGKTVTDAATGKGFRVGNVAQGMAAGILGLVVANQIINLATRGKPTWDNPEEGHKFDAWLPGGPHNRGFFFGPLELTAEFTHAMQKYMGGGENAVDAATHIASNKLSGVGRALKDLATGVDYKGQPFGSLGERLKAAAVDALPSPLPLGAFLQKDPKGPLGYGLNHEKGSVEKQAFGMAGMKLENAPSARNQMYAMADRFKATPDGAKATGSKGAAAGGQSARPASAYGDLRRYLDSEDASAARDEVQRLVTQGGKSLPQIGKALGIEAGGKLKPELFTGSLEGDRAMVKQFTPAQAQLWHQALADRVANARLFEHVLASLPADQKRALQIASAMNGRGNKTGAAQVGKSSVLQPGNQAPSVPAQPAAPALRPRTRIADAFRS